MISIKNVKTLLSYLAIRRAKVLANTETDTKIQIRKIKNEIK